jgi:hypothetical protein
MKIIIEHYRINKFGWLYRHKRNQPDFTPQTRGGMTICRLLTDAEQFVGYAYCSNKDNFCYKTGRILAFERARKALLVRYPEYQM